MAIFVIGYKEDSNGERLVRLYNSDRKQTRDMKEKDLLFLKNDLKIMNADVEGKKLKGTTGSLEKVLNQYFFVIVSAKANKDGILGYNIVNIDGEELYVDLKDMPFFFRDCTVQNASLVNANNGTFVRGINWTIPIIEEKDTLPKNIKYGCAYSSEVASKLMKPNKNEVIISIDGFGTNGEFYIAKSNNGMGLSLGLSFKDYILNISEELFSPMVKELSKTGWCFLADKDNFAVRVRIDKPTFSQQLSRLSGICYGLKCRLIMNDFSNLTEYLTSQSAFRLTKKELEPVFTNFGMRYMLKSSLYGEDELSDVLRIKETFNIDINDNNYLALLLNWRCSVVDGYHSYLTTLCSQYGIENSISDSCVYSENEMKKNLHVKFENNGIIYCSNTPCGKPGNIKGCIAPCTYNYNLMEVEGKSLTVEYGKDYIFELYMDLKTLIQFIEFYKVEKKWFDVFEGGILVEGFSQQHQSYSISLLHPNCNIDMIYKWFNLLGRILNCKIDLDVSNVIDIPNIEIENNTDYPLHELLYLANNGDMSESEFESLIVQSLIYFAGIPYAPVRNKRNGYPNPLTVNFNTFMNTGRENVISCFNRINDKVKHIVQHKTNSTIIFK